MSDRAPRKRKRVASPAPKDVTSKTDAALASSGTAKDLPKKSSPKKSSSSTTAADPTSAASITTGYNPPRWDELEVDISELSPYERNPRKITTDAFNALVKSLQQDGYHNRVKTTHDLKIVAGHQRLRVLKQLGYSKIKVLVPNRPLTPDEFARNLIKDNLPHAGLFDYDILGADYDAAWLLDIGMPADWLDDVPVPDVKTVSFDVQSKVDQGVKHKCPKCGEVFEE